MWLVSFLYLGKGGPPEKVLERGEEKKGIPPFEEKKKILLT